LAHDFGQALGCGAYLSSLCRTRIGEFKNEDAMSMEEFEKTIDKNKTPTAIRKDN
jgi:tRNA pseudouridine55 synthase